LSRRYLAYATHASFGVGCQRESVHARWSRRSIQGSTASVHSTGTTRYPRTMGPPSKRANAGKQTPFCSTTRGLATIVLLPVSLKCAVGCPALRARHALGLRCGLVAGHVSATPRANEPHGWNAVANRAAEFVVVSFHNQCSVNMAGRAHHVPSVAHMLSGVAHPSCSGRTRSAPASSFPTNRWTCCVNTVSQQHRWIYVRALGMQPMPFLTHPSIQR
jgi:hypothetical protein